MSLDLSSMPVVVETAEMGPVLMVCTAEAVANAGTSIKGWRRMSTPGACQSIDPGVSSSEPTFDYSGIPTGYYDEVMRTGHPVRRAWHLQKFERVRECLPTTPGQSILDIGCFAGTFLSLLPEVPFAMQVGVDILPPQIEYANAHFGTAFRRFAAIRDVTEIQQLPETFDVVTIIEVIEHLQKEEIRKLFESVVTRTKPGARIVFSTPNYASAWPAVEWLVNRVSDVSYEEQHITKFNYFTLEKQLRHIAPALFDRFSVDFVTSTHFVSPFTAAVSLDFAMKMSRVVPHRKWHNPFGNLLLVGLTART